MAKPKDFEERWTDLGGKLDDLIGEVKQHYPAAFEDIEDDWQTINHTLDVIQDTMYDIDQGAFDDE